MRIGLDGIPLAFPKTGIGHYTFELAKSLARVASENDFELVYPSTFPPISTNGNGVTSEPANLSSTRVPVGPLGRHWWSAGLPRYIRRQAIELFHGTNYDVPLWRPCTTVLTVHDLSLLLHPETHEKRSVRRARWRLPLMVKTADAVIVPSEAVRPEICEHLNISSEKVFVVPEATRQCFHPIEFEESAEVRRRFDIGDEFILTVGTIEPRKNLQLLVSAFEHAAAARPESRVQLVIAGGRGWLSEPLFKAVDNSPVQNRIVLTDYLHDEDLCALYSACRMFVYPSLYEGFGLPPLEAMACGASVIVSNIPALVETTGQAARLVDPRDPCDLARSILGLLTDEDERRRLSITGRQRASEFSWEKTARKTLEVYEDALRRSTSEAR
jgi:glycosyltransferase involved in cell wall biosynthesis